MVAKSRERSEADTLLIIRERSERTKELPPPTRKRTLTERSGDDSPIGLLSIGEGSPPLYEAIHGQGGEYLFPWEREHTRREPLISLAALFAYTQL